MEVLQTIGLSKHFGSLKAVDQVCLHVQAGELYGFMGQNGAGKTTLIRMLLGMIRPSAGELRLFGQKAPFSPSLWHQVGYLVESPYAYPNLTVAENLQVFARLRSLKKDAVGRIIHELNLTRYRTTPVRHLSLGNQQRLGLAKALMHRPKLLLLDEPTNGLDPGGIVEVRQLLRELTQTGTTIFLSSHLLSEVSQLATRIGIIHQGALIQELSPEALNEQLIHQLLVETVDNEKAGQVLQAAGFAPSRAGANLLALSDPGALAAPEKIAQLLVEAGCPPKQLTPEVETLEAYFLRLTAQLSPA